MRNLAEMIFCALVIWGTAEAKLMMMPVSSPGESFTCKGSGISTIITSAQDPFLQQEDPSTSQVSVLSQVLCAIRSNLGRAVGYSYDGGVCTLFGPGKGYGNESVVFRLSDFPLSQDLEEVARNKDTHASNNWIGFNKHYAVDGIINVDTNVYINTASLLHPWWIVDIGEMRTIHQIQIYPRQSYAPGRFHNTEIRVGPTLKTDGDLSSYELLSSYTGPYSPDVGYVICSSHEGIVGRYISFQAMTTNVDDLLQIQDVNVFVREA